VNRTIHVKQQVGRTSHVIKDLKDKESRIVPLSDSLAEILRGGPHFSSVICSWSGFPLDLHRMGLAFHEAMAALNLPAMRWYDATRHTFASQWVLNGGTLETLREMMGHSSVTMTERYAHLIPGRYTDADRARVQVDAPEKVLLTN